MAMTHTHTHTQSNVTLLMFNTIKLLFISDSCSKRQHRLLQPPPHIFIFPNPLLIPLFLTPSPKATQELEEDSRYAISAAQPTPGVFRALTTNCAQVKALGTRSTDLGDEDRYSCSAGM